MRRAGSFSNLYVLRFDDDGRCSEFVEWYIASTPQRLRAARSTLHGAA